MSTLATAIMPLEKFILKDTIMITIMPMPTLTLTLTLIHILTDNIWTMTEATHHYGKISTRPAATADINV
jgi:hypothetical protein